MTLTQEQLTILDKIDQGGTHAFYTVEFVHEIEEAFGFKRGSLVSYERANTGDSKGLYVEGAARGARIAGASSHHIADMLATKLGVTYQHAYGRGTNQWRAMAAIRAACAK
jgi:hypothetical protein